jgi:predicted SprT family Zn-dependent metalloprotease
MFDSFFRFKKTVKKSAKPRKQSPQPEKLVTAMHRVNNEYFSFEKLPSIRWSRGRIQKQYRKLTIGCYDIKKNEIRIHPLFRERELPVELLDFVIYHELLHYEDRHHLKIRRNGKRIHNRDFKVREKSHPYSKTAHQITKTILNGNFLVASKKNLLKIKSLPHN